PLLEKIRTARPDHLDAAVRCAARLRSPRAIPLLRRAMLDGVESDNAGLGLVELGTPDALAALEEALRTGIVRKGSAPWTTVRAYAGKSPAAWRKLAAALDRDHPKGEKVQGYLRETWQALARGQVLKSDDVPPKFRAGQEN